MLISISSIVSTSGAAGSIVLSEASDPGPVRITEIRDAVLKLEVNCVFAEPQFEPKLIATVIEGTDARSGMLDPLGASLQAGTRFVFTALAKSGSGSRGLP